VSTPRGRNVPGRGRVVQRITSQELTGLTSEQQTVYAKWIEVRRKIFGNDPEAEEMVLQNIKDLDQLRKYLSTFDERAQTREERGTTYDISNVLSTIKLSDTVGGRTLIEKPPKVVSLSNTEFDQVYVKIYYHSLKAQLQQNLDSKADVRALAAAVRAAARVDAVSAFFNPDDRCLYLRPSEKPGELIHEALHYYSSSAFGTTFGVWLEEGVTEFLAREIVSEGFYSEPAQQAYKNNVAMLGALLKGGYITQGAIKQAYFDGQTSALMTELGDLLGGRLQDTLQASMRDDGTPLIANITSAIRERRGGQSASGVAVGGGGGSRCCGGCKCFITSACVEAKGLPDDCRELTTLRRFRDGYVRALAEGPALISEYYEIAPRIVARIKARPDATRIFARIYERLVRAVDLITAGLHDEALRVYRDLVLDLKNRYLA
jgi:hypothetical protein